MFIHLKFRYNRSWCSGVSRGNDQARQHATEHFTPRFLNPLNHSTPRSHPHNLTTIQHHASRPAQSPGASAAPPNIPLKRIGIAIAVARTTLLTPHPLLFVDLEHPLPPPRPSAPPPRPRARDSWRCSASRRTRRVRMRNCSDCRTLRR